MAHTPLKMSVDEAHAEVNYGWAKSYSPEAIAHAVHSFNYKPLAYRINILIARLCFRGNLLPANGSHGLGKKCSTKMPRQSAKLFGKVFKIGSIAYATGACNRYPWPPPAIKLQFAQSITDLFPYTCRCARLSSYRL